MNYKLLILTACLFIINTTPVLSHHARSQFQRDASTTLEGKVIDFQWRNPHTWIELEVINENNETEVWLIAGSTPSALKKQGWSRESFKAGDTVVVVGNPHRDPKIKQMYMISVVLEDGEALYVVSSRFRPKSDLASTGNNPDVTPSKDFSGTWARGRSNGLSAGYFEPPSNWPLTKLGEEQFARFDELNNPAYDCLERGLPFFPIMPYWQAWIRHEDRIEIILQNSEFTRTLYLNQDTHPDEIEPSLGGHSIAHFDEDGSLVVDTVGFPTDVRWGLAAGVDSSEQKHVSERYTLSKNGREIELSMTFKDPIYLMEPVTVNGSYNKVADDPFDTYVCDLESARKELEEM